MIIRSKQSALRKRCAVSALALLAALGSTTLAHAECTKDTECKGDRVCNAGVCVAPTNSPAAPAAAPAAPPAATAPLSAPPAYPVAPGGAVPGAPPTYPGAPVPVYLVSTRAPEGPMHRRSGALMGAGIAFIVLGFGTLIASVVLWPEYSYWTNQVATDPETSCATKNPPCDVSLLTAATITTVLTPIFLGAGIPMLIIGAKKVPDSGSQGRAKPTWIPQVNASKHTMGLSFAF